MLFRIIQVVENVIFELPVGEPVVFTFRDERFPCVPIRVSRHAVWKQGDVVAHAHAAGREFVHQSVRDVDVGRQIFDGFSHVGIVPKSPQPLRDGSGHLLRGINLGNGHVDGLLFSHEHGGFDDAFPVLHIRALVTMDFFVQHDVDPIDDSIRGMYHRKMLSPLSNCFLMT